MESVYTADGDVEESGRREKVDTDVEKKGRGASRSSRTVCGRWVMVRRAISGTDDVPVQASIRTLFFLTRIPAMLIGMELPFIPFPISP
ncbi:hypothetical protein L1987_46726 [Smallanthus sonchifolius]|uniref:Uncharacterized protein n=1 Tax=Smallanthus sonchifolius TaxID=185202 RepID=A0ACB9FZY8_9ASTR|nr:hypothetical protein L1987_46726 [Smallanthus sonchifolius]